MSLVDTETGEVHGEMLIDDIVIGERARVDLGDLADLKDSITAIGLLQPIVVDSERVLIAGRRRLAAVSELGWSWVPVTVATSVTDAVDRIIAERDENTCRKDFAPSEAVALGMRLEELVRPLAQERMAEAGRSAAPGRPAERGGDSPPLSPTGKTRDLVAPAVGMKPSRYARAKTVVTAQDDPDPEVAQAAREARHDMDATGNVESAYRKVAAARATHVESADPPKGTTRSSASVAARLVKARELAATGHTSRQIADALGISRATMATYRSEHGLDVPADAVIGKRRQIDSNRVVEQTVLGLEGETQGLHLITFGDLDPDRIDGWVTSLDDSLRLLNRFRKQLKEMTQ